ncbi:hypothetical protein L873DRAFT_1828290 [Choiromyces venosus 120613-1]|uniref:Uncharacterized protein n=1 Tax=Choiromyces venosus 120613-1 TaxID=1336337 RepID=A0A3N4JRR0_9PEZI|nr:hypothetical protein L873DRAFT_1828290 [Choiromyces venosus 120613-1]
MSKSATGSAGTSPPVRGKTAKISVVRAQIGLKNEKYEWNKLVTISAKAFQKFNQENGFARTPTWSTLTFTQQQTLIECVKEYANMTPGCVKYFEDHPWLPEYLLYQRTRNKNTARKKEHQGPGSSAGEAEDEEEEEAEDGNGSAREDQVLDGAPGLEEVSGPADNQDTLRIDFLLNK